MSRHVDGPRKGRVNNSEQLTQPDPKPAGINMVSPRRVCCVCPVSFLHPSIRPTEHPSVPAVCSWTGWSLTHVLTRLVTAVCEQRGLLFPRRVISRVNPSSRGPCQGHGRLSSREKTRALLKETLVEDLEGPHCPDDESTSVIGVDTSQFL